MILFKDFYTTSPVKDP